MDKIKLNKSIAVRNYIQKNQANTIIKMYKEVSNKINIQISSLKGYKNVSSNVERIYLQTLQKQIDNEIDNIGKMLNYNINNNMLKVSSAVVKDNVQWLKKYKIDSIGALSNVPTKIVKNVRLGLIYEKPWNLSSAIWSSIDKNKMDIQKIVSMGIAQQKSAYEIAKDLEKYVNPLATKDWDWSKVYPGTSRKVDYNAQRLARTMVSHAYEQSVIETCRVNPFIEGILWQTSNSDRTCEICIARDGIIYKDMNEVPLDHPNGMCSFIPVTLDNNEIVDRIADWANGGNDKELDKFINELKK